MYLNRIFKLVLAVSVLTFGACAGLGNQQVSNASDGNDITPSDFGPPLVWGAANNVVNVKHLFISAQPDESTLERAKDEGVAVVINLRKPDESSWDEAQAAERKGLIYYNVPLARHGDGFEKDAVEKISELVKKHHNQKTLIHCASGNRASAWLAIHLANDHGMRTSTAIERARLASLNKAAVEQRVRTYLEQSGVN